MTNHLHLIFSHDPRGLVLSMRGESDERSRVESLIASTKPKYYHEAIDLLVDLKKKKKKNRTIRSFNSQLKNIKEKHRRKYSFINRLDMAGL